MATPSPALAVFLTAMRVFEDYDSDEREVAAQIERLNPWLSAPESEPARAPFEHWRAAFARAQSAATRDDLKAVLREYMCTPSPHAASPYNIAQGLMKATAHLVWKKLHAVESRWHRRPADAIRDAITPQRERGIEYVRVLYEEIAAEQNETVDEMMRRVCGD